MDKLGRRVLLLWSFFGMAIPTAFQLVAAGLFVSTSGPGALYLSVGGMLMDFIPQLRFHINPNGGDRQEDINPKEEKGSTVACANLRLLGQFLAAKRADGPQEALQILDIVLRELSTKRYCPVGRSFFSPNIWKPQQLGEGPESCTVWILPEYLTYSDGFYKILNHHNQAARSYFHFILLL